LSFLSHIKSQEDTSLNFRGAFGS